MSTLGHQSCQEFSVHENVIHCKYSNAGEHLTASDLLAGLARIFVLIGLPHHFQKNDMLDVHSPSTAPSFLLDLQDCDKRVGCR